MFESSSVAEHPLHTGRVVGSIPISRTIQVFILEIMASGIHPGEFYLSISEVVDGSALSNLVNNTYLTIHTRSPWLSRERRFEVPECDSPASRRRSRDIQVGRSILMKRQAISP